MDNSKNLDLLFEKYLAGQCTLEDLRVLLSGFNNLDEDSVLLNRLSNQIKQDISGEDNLKLRELVEKLDIGVYQALGDRKQTANKSGVLRLVKRFTAAAALFLIVGTALFLFFRTEATKDIRQTVDSNNIAPGQMGATLTLADGRKIKLGHNSGGKIANQEGFTIIRTPDGKIDYRTDALGNRNSQAILSNTISTAKGETFSMTLPDKSKVWLNAGSQLTYALAIGKDGFREVHLQGEAYFEVARDHRHPFVVSSLGQRVEVTGTHFNINSYQDEEGTSTTLLEGAVRVTPTGNSDAKNVVPTSVLLRPGEQSVLRGKLSLRVSKGDINEAVAWQQGYFRFNQESIESIMRKLARWYNVEVVYQGAVAEESFTGRISRSRNISNVLNMLEKTNGIHFKVEGRRIIVMK